jgi:type I restriction enzyme R subunit
MREAVQRGEELGLIDDELALYDALAQNASAIQVMGGDEWKVIATELVRNVRKSVTIDWTLR